jgi:excisionase family DNA binding protein
METEKLLLNVSECASALGISRSKVYELLASGALESVHIGRSRRVPMEAASAFVERLRDVS